MFLEKGTVEQELNEKVAKKVTSHRNRFARLFLLRYKELLPQIIHYKGAKEKTAIDFIKLEIGLRENYNIVVGQAKNKEIMILGYTMTTNTITEKTNFFTNFDSTIKFDDVIFTIPKNLIPDKKDFKEITLNDNAKTGNFIVVRNKSINYINDTEILDHYTIQLAEIVTSRFSLNLQAKVMTFLKGNIGDETINQIAEELYNGSVYSKVSDFFDPREQIITINNANISNNLQQLKREYQNTISELNAFIGIDSLGVDKESGVSATEADSNESFTKGNGNIYIAPREQAFSLLNKRFSLDIYPVFNNQVLSEIQKLEIITEVIE